MMFAKALVHHKVGMYGTVNILGFNSPEWFIANTGAILGGCIAAGIYTTNLREACFYISKHSKAQIVVVEGNKQLAKYIESRSELYDLKALVVWGEPVDPSIEAKCSVPVYSWEKFLSCGESVGTSEVERRGDSVKPGNCSTLIYTSGTTGPPKAVMISHDNITWTTANIMEGGYMDLNHEDRVVSYLPLSHIAAQIIDVHAMMNLGGQTYFAQPDALKGSLGETLRSVKPTFFFGVPRVWEKIQESIVAIGRENTSVAKTWLVGWAKGRATAKTEMAQYPPKDGVPSFYGCANSIILSKIKEKLGLEESKACFTAAAPISTETLNYFGSLDIPVYEVFGQSECTGPHTFSAACAWKIGTCGRPIQGSTSIIDGNTGELCYTGRHIFMGYMYNPEDTTKTVDDQGFLHSGDVAAFDADDHPDVPSPSGFMRITGRIKELIITAGGENIPPVLIEK
jgi:long-chain-fatty-acid--CoA ligase ACSBG